MDFRKLAERALRAGAREGIKFVGRRLQDPATRDAVTGILTGDDRQDRPARPRQGTARTPGGSGSRQGTGTAGGKKAGTASPRADYGHARSAERSAPRQGFPKRPSGGYPGDFTGTVSPVYKPDLDGDADPGEVVWAWVPFEEDPTQGKDRPVLIVGHDGRWLLGLMLSSKDHVPGSVGDIHETEYARWVNVGSGDWDAQGRQSEIRLDRVIRISPNGVRREGAIMPMELYSQVVSHLG